MVLQTIENVEVLDQLVAKIHICRLHAAHAFASYKAIHSSTCMQQHIFLK